MIGLFSRKNKEYKIGLELYQEKRFKEALSHITYAANKGLVDAQLLLGNYYCELGNPEDDKLCVYWYKKAAKKGNAEAKYQLAMQYVERWDVLGYCLYTKQNTIDNIGDCIFTGIFSGVVKDVKSRKSYNSLEMEKAYDKFERIIKKLLGDAAKQGHKEAIKEYKKYFSE